MFLNFGLRINLDEAELQLNQKLKCTAICFGDDNCLQIRIESNDEVMVEKGYAWVYDGGKKEKDYGELKEKRIADRKRRVKSMCTVSRFENFSKKFLRAPYIIMMMLNLKISEKA